MKHHIKTSSWVLCMLMLTALLLTACKSADGLSKAERKARTAQMVANALQNREFTIEVDWMRPLGGKPTHVNSNYGVKVKGDAVDSYLPYFGEAYNLPYGGGKGLNFEGEITDYAVTRKDGKQYLIEMKIVNDEDNFIYYIEVFDNGKASIDVISRNRDPISFDGEMVF